MNQKQFSGGFPSLVKPCYVNILGARHTYSMPHLIVSKGWNLFLAFAFNDR